MSELRNDERLTETELRKIGNPIRGAAGVEEPPLSEEATPEEAQPLSVNPAVEARSPQVDTVRNQGAHPLFPGEELQSFRSSWETVQTSFVDEPRAAVEQADALVANVAKRIAERFATEREQLEKQWDRGEQVNTEDLRQALKRYRAFFDRLLAL
jgi:hypothetical protein